MADYGDLARAQVQKHFPKFGTFRRSVTYNSKGNDLYDTTTGVVTPDPGGTATLFVIFLSFGILRTSAAERQIDDAPVLAQDRKVIFPAADLPYTPKVGDIITEGSTQWRVIGVNDDPKPAHYALHVRPRLQS